MTKAVTRGLIGVWLALAAGNVLAERIAIIGTGNVGAALGTEFAAQGHEIIYGSRDPARDEVQALVGRTAGNAAATTQSQAIDGADIVVLAVPGQTGGGNRYQPRRPRRQDRHRSDQQLHSGGDPAPGDGYLQWRVVAGSAARHAGRQGIQHAEHAADG